MAPEGGPIAGTVVREFRSDEWGELYGKRVEEMIGVLKARGVPVFWVGLPSVRGSRATAEMVYLNDIYRARAEKAGIIYVDIWDGFVDDGGNYNNYGPDFEGQTRRLRSGDGVHFTRSGARKLAHYVERELRRVMQARLTPVATPAPQEPEPEAEKAPADCRRARIAATSDRKPGDVADRAARRRRHAARRCARAQHLGRLCRDACAGERRGDRGSGRTRRRFCLASPGRHHGNRRAAPRSGRAAAARGTRSGDRACRAVSSRRASQAGGRAAPRAARRTARRPDGSLGAGRNTSLRGRIRAFSAGSAETLVASQTSARGRLPRQVCRAHQELVDRVRSLTALADRPHDQRLAAPHVAGREDLRI